MPAQTPAPIVGPRPVGIIVVTLALLICSFDPASSQSSHVSLAVEGDELWDDRFFAPFPGEIQAIALDDTDRLLVAGFFDQLGGTIADGLARWDGETWDGFRLDGISFVQAIVSGSGGVVAFASNRRVRILAEGAWHETPDLPERVNSLTVTADGLFAGGGLQKCGFRQCTWEGFGVMKWQDGAWARVDDNLEVVFDLHSTNQGELFAIAMQTAAPPHFWQRTGSTWRQLGSTVALDEARLFSSTEGVLYASGRFRNEGAVFTGIIRWNGDEWVPFRSVPDVSVPAAFDSQGRLYALIRTVDGYALERHEDGEWSVLDESLGAFPLRGMTIDSEGRIYVHGRIETAHFSDVLVLWDGESWRQIIPRGVGSQERVMNVVYSGSHDAFYSTGVFYLPEMRDPVRFAMWKEGRWKLPGDQPQMVRTFALDESGHLVASGTLDLGEETSHLARWDGETWTSIVSELTHPWLAALYISSITVAPQGDIFVYGRFASIDGVSANNIARYDGSSWHPLGEGVEDDVNISAMYVDAEGRLIAGGAFARIGGTEARSIAAWDGEAWHPLGAGLSVPWGNFVGFVSAIVPAPEGLIVGGSFHRAGEATAGNIALWDGDEWHPVGDGFNDSVFDIIVSGSGNLIAGGGFSWSGTVPVNSIAEFDGESWVALGSGVMRGQNPGIVRTLSFGSEMDLFVGGEFTRAGNRPAFNITRWFGATGASIENGPPVYEGPIVITGIFPNPSVGDARLSLTFDPSEEIRIALYDVLGREVLLIHDGLLPQGGNATLSIPTAGLASGAYWLSVSSPDSRVTRSLTILR